MSQRFLVTSVLVVLIAIALAFGIRAAAGSQLVPSPESLRFRLVGDEPISGPDGRSIVTGWKVLVFQDLESSRCYLAFTRGDSMAVAGDVPCARPPARP
jgi:hypothetical protein